MTDYNYINLAAIEEVSGGDQDLTIDIISMFLQGAPELLSEIQVNLNNENHEGIASVAHKLKPMFAYVGVMTVKEDLEKIEIQSRQEEPLEILSASIKEVNEKMADIIAELNTLKSSLMTG